LGTDGAPQVRPVGFSYNPELDTIDIGGMNMGASRKYRNVQADGRVSFVVDDLASVDPWRPRGVEVRGRAETVPGSAAGRELIRIFPGRVLGWGLAHARQRGPGERANAQLKSWKILRKIRCSPSRATTVVQAVQALILTG
jgi:pyridoxamine 5'-phosphate oxidase family protein